LEECHQQPAPTDCVGARIEGSGKTFSKFCRTSNLLESDSRHGYAYVLVHAIKWVLAGKASQDLFANRPHDMNNPNASAKSSPSEKLTSDISCVTRSSRPPDVAERFAKDLITSMVLTSRLFVVSHGEFHSQAISNSPASVSP